MGKKLRVDVGDDAGFDIAAQRTRATSRPARRVGAPARSSTRSIRPAAPRTRSVASAAAGS